MISVFLLFDECQTYCLTVPVKVEDLLKRGFVVEITRCFVGNRSGACITVHHLFGVPPPNKFICKIIISTLVLHGIFNESIKYLD